MNTTNNIVEVKRSWWYKTFRSIGMFCYKYWWFILLLLIAAILFFWFYIYKQKQKELEFCKKYATAERELRKLDSIINNCLSCNITYIDTTKLVIDTLHPPAIDTSVVNNGPITACDFKKDNDGGQGQDETKYALGSKSGIVNISYDMVDEPDKMDVYYDGKLVATTSRLVSKTGALTFRYNAQIGKPEYCIVIMTAPRDGTHWYYTVHCPN